MQRVLARLHEVGRQRQLLFNLLNHPAPAWQVNSQLCFHEQRHWSRKHSTTAAT